MNIIKYIVIVVITSIFFTSCEKAFFKPIPATDALAIFDEYDKLVTEKYAMLEFKKVDIDVLTDSLRATINEDISDLDLLIKLANITAQLRDGHSAIIGEVNGEVTGYVFDTYEGYPVAYDSTILYNNYINPSNMNVLEGADEPTRMIYGQLVQDNELGYLLLPSFDVTITEEELEEVFSTLKETKGLIIDVRGNGGGDPALATMLASYFMNETTYTGFERFKTGPGVNDFTDSPSNVEPMDSDNRYLKPVAVLTDRGVYSATTTLSYSLNPLPQVTFIGQRTGGGSGSVADGYLANGWNWSLSTSEFIDHENRHLDDGIDPDIQVLLNLDDITKDEILERAIQELQ